MPITVCQLSSVHVRSDVRVYYKECVSLAMAGYKVHLILADGRGNDKKHDITIHDLGKPKGRVSRMLSVPLRLYLKALKAKADLYHFHDPELLPIGLLLKLTTKAKVIYDAHESYPDDLRYKDYLAPWLRWLASFGIRILENFVARRLDAVITVTDYHAKRFKAINNNTITVCNYPLLSEWEPYLATETERTPNSLCYVGNITRKRGLNVLLKAIEPLELTLHLAGGYEPSDYRAELMSLPAWRKVVEHGYLNRGEAIKLMSASQIGVMLFLPEPNHINSLSTKVFEYMAAGCAVLVSDFPVYRNLVSDSGCGVCVDPENIEEVRLAIQKLLSSPETVTAMGQRGKRLIQESYNWESQEKQLLGIYANLLKDRY